MDHPGLPTEMVILAGGNLQHWRRGDRLAGHPRGQDRQQLPGNCGTGPFLTGSGFLAPFPNPGSNKKVSFQLIKNIFNFNNTPPSWLKKIHKFLIICFLIEFNQCWTTKVKSVHNSEGAGDGAGHSNRLRPKCPSFGRLRLCNKTEQKLWSQTVCFFHLGQILW